MIKIKVGQRVLYQPPESGRRDQPKLDPIEAEVVAVKAEDEVDLLVQDADGNAVTIYGARKSKVPEIARWRDMPAAPVAVGESAKEEKTAPAAPVATAPLAAARPFTTSDLRPQKP